MEEILYLLSFYFLEISMSAKDSCGIRQIVWFGIYKVTQVLAVLFIRDPRTNRLFGPSKFGL